jgi:tRNA (guanine6-N2)-methyltransferase
VPAFEAECIVGLEPFATAELQSLISGLAADARDRGARRGSVGAGFQRPTRSGTNPNLPASSQQPLPSGPNSNLPALPPLPRARGRGLGCRGSSDGVVPFAYDGPWPPLLQLRTIVAVHAVLAVGLPRPTFLLDDGTFRRITAGIGHIRSLYPAGAFRSYRLSAAGADSPVFQRFQARLGQATGLKPADDAGDLLLRFRRGADGRFELLARISPRPLAARAWRVCNRPGALNAAVASVMADLTRPHPDQVYLNLACGSGTLLIERAQLGPPGPAGRLVGCDTDPDALACSARSVAAAGLDRAELTDWDATSLPLPDASVDALTVDLPFGQLVGSHAENAELYPRLLAEASRVARPGARLVAISQQVRLLERSIDPARWSTESVLRPTLSTSGGPIKPGIFVLTRR